MKLSETHAKIFEALAKVRDAIVQPSKDGQANYGQYVTLDTMEKTISAAEKGSGLTHLQELTSGERSVNVTTFIMHSSGEYIQFDTFSLPAAKADAQGFGSAATYARRYSLAAAYGIVSDEDDDGNNAVESVGGKSAKQQTGGNGYKKTYNKVHPPKKQPAAAKQASYGPSAEQRVTQAVKSAAERTGDTIAHVIGFGFAKAGIIYSKDKYSALTQDEADSIIKAVNALAMQAQA